MSQSDRVMRKIPFAREAWNDRSLKSEGYEPQREVARQGRPVSQKENGWRKEGGKGARK